MGGLGSGNRYRTSTKTCCEEVRCLDVNKLNKDNVFRVGFSGIASWLEGETKVASIGIASFEHHIRLRYDFSSGNSEKVAVEQSVQLSRTPCHYGSQRTWFRCGGCSKRVTKLYNGGKYFYCRQCYDLPYASQHEGKSNYLYTRRHKLGNKTFSHYKYGEGWGKPKGQHWKTFDRKLAKYKKADRAVTGHLLAFLQSTGLDRSEFEGL